MGYLDNTVITVDAILTKRGRELLARNDGSFKVTQFALADDEIDYTLFNEDHPNGSQYSGEAIENMPVLEAFPDENNIMIHKLITLPRGTSKLPVVTANVTKLQLSIGSTATVNPTTLNFSGLSNLKEPGGYYFTCADRRLFNSFLGIGRRGRTRRARPFTQAALSETVRGQSISVTAINSTSLFGTNSRLLTTITIEGADSGARVTIPVELTKDVIAVRNAVGESGIQLR
jgi:hypothetical protein|tara:strand:- start:3997 stop:4689 length:693 start_codon:yes stop_codon:yes gene_type:complete